MFISEMERLERADEFLQKAKLKHGSRFNYSKVNYINNITKVTVFEQFEELDFYRN